MNDGKENLIPFSERSKEEARENGRKGGQASGRSRRQKAQAKKIVEDILNDTYTFLKIEIRQYWLYKFVQPISRKCDSLVTGIRCTHNKIW